MDMRTEVTDPIGAIASLDEPKRRQLYEFVVASHGPVGRDESAAATGMSRELVAFHLDRLVEAGLLETEYKRLGGRRGPGAGRPAKLYRRSDRDLAVSFPSRDYERAAHLLAGALEQLDRDPGTPSSVVAVAEVARARGATEGAEARRSAGPRPSRRRLRAALIDLLGRAGYAPDVAPDTGRIDLRSCPYDALAASHRDLTCGMNVAWAEGVLDGLGHSGLAAKLAPADDHCCVVFEGAGSEVVKRSRDIPAVIGDTKG
jgi:predicted ArsR family transcriptional regulator